MRLYKTGRMSKVIKVAPVKPQAMLIASPRQKALGNIGIRPRTVVSAVSMMGRNRTITDSVIALIGFIPSVRC